MTFIFALCITATSACTQRPPNLDEQAYIWIAVKSKSIEPCKKIGKAAIGKAAFNPAGYQVDSLRSRCFRMVALATGKEELCEDVVPVSRLRVFWFDGSKYTPEDCREKVAKKRTTHHSIVLGNPSRLMSSLQYNDATIFQECTNRFSTKKATLDYLKNKFIKQYDTCIAREMRVGSGLERSRQVYGVSDKRREFCHQRTLLLSGTKDYYFGKRANDYPGDRRFGYCEHYCSTYELDGYCRKTDEKLPEEVYIKFLASQVRFGELFQLLELMPDY